MNAFEAEVQNGEGSCYTQLHKAALVDLDGFLLTTDERKILVKDYQWFQTAIKGQRAITEPFISVPNLFMMKTIFSPVS